MYRTALEGSVRFRVTGASRHRGRLVRRVHSAGGCSQHLGRKSRHRRQKADHVPQRCNRAVRTDTLWRHSGPCRDAEGGLIESVRPGGGAGLDRDEAEAWAEHPCHAGSRPVDRWRRVAPKPGSRPLPATAHRSSRFGHQREEHRGHHAGRPRVRRVPEGKVDRPSQLSYPAAC